MWKHFLKIDKIKAFKELNAEEMDMDKEKMEEEEKEEKEEEKGWHFH